MPLDRKLRLSVNPGLINKNDSGDRSLFTRGWENTELSAAELADWVKGGFAFCAQVAGPRKAANFVASDVVSVDIDGTRTIEDALEDDIVKRYATLMYTTARHTPEDHRFRIVFALPRTITEPKEMAALARSLALRLAGDRAAVDATRISYGSKGAQTWLFDRELSASFLDELIAQSINPPQRELAGSAQLVGGARSGLRLAPDQLVRVAGGSAMPFSQIPPKAAVHCPFHHDREPSAFITTNTGGTNGYGAPPAARPSGRRPQATAFSTSANSTSPPGGCSPTSRSIRTSGRSRRSSV